jgi:hypothetical protein
VGRRSPRSSGSPTCRRAPECPRCGAGCCRARRRSLGALRSPGPRTRAAQSSSAAAAAAAAEQLARQGAFRQTAARGRGSSCVQATPASVTRSTAARARRRIQIQGTLAIRRSGAQESEVVGDLEQRLHSRKQHAPRAAEALAEWMVVIPKQAIFDCLAARAGLDS